MSESPEFTTIISLDQYNDYCTKLQNLLATSDINADYDIINDLTFLIDKWKQQNSSFEDLNPIELLKTLMVMHKLKSKHMIEILGISKLVMADILNYKKGLTKDNIQILSNQFGVVPEAFNRPYKLKPPVKKGYSNKIRIITK